MKAITTGLIIVLSGLFLSACGSKKWIMFKVTHTQTPSGQVGNDIKLGEYASKEDCMGARGQADLKDKNLDDNYSPYFCGTDCSFGKYGVNTFICDEICGQAKCIKDNEIVK